MKNRLLTIAAAAAILMPSTASAVGTKTYDFCGGSYSGYVGFAFCASVKVSVAAASNADGLTHAAGAYTVTLDITNKSGENGSFVNSMFIQIGLDNLINDLADPENVVIRQGGNIVCKNIYDVTTGKMKCYNVQEDKKAAGGVRLDFLASANNGVSQYAITSCTANVAGLHTCPNQSVQISFDVRSDFDPNAGVQVYVKSQGQLGSTECQTGTGNPIPCYNPPPPPVVATPEPATWAMLGTGLAGVLLYRRRKTESV